MEGLKKQAGFKRSLRAFYDELRSDPKYFYPNTDEGREAYRLALSAAQAADELRTEAAKGRLAPDAVNAVLVAAGQPREPVPRPAGLSERECDVLGLVARGLATKQVARQLGISPKTCDHHIQSVYSKVGVSTRAGAILFALEHGLVSPGVTPGG